MADSGSGLTEHTQVNTARLREVEGRAVTTMRLARVFMFELWCQCANRMSDDTWHKEAGDDHIENMATATMIHQQAELLHGAKTFSKGPLPKDFASKRSLSKGPSCCPPPANYQLTHPPSAIHPRSSPATRRQPNMFVWRNQWLA